MIFHICKNLLGLPEGQNIEPAGRFPITRQRRPGREIGQLPEITAEFPARLLARGGSWFIFTGRRTFPGNASFPNTALPRTGHWHFRRDGTRRSLCRPHLEHARRPTPPWTSFCHPTPPNTLPLSPGRTPHRPTISLTPFFRPCWTRGRNASPCLPIPTCLAAIDLAHTGCSTTPTATIHTHVNTPSRFAPFAPTRIHSPLLRQGVRNFRQGLRNTRLVTPPEVHTPTPTPPRSDSRSFPEQPSHKCVLNRWRKHPRLLPLPQDPRGSSADPPV
jgi:hypothetical protein